MRKFKQTLDPSRRRQLIGEARHRGSMPRELRRAVSQAIAQNEVEWHKGDVVSRLDAPRPTLLLSTGREVTGDRIVLATGLATRRPGGAMLDELIATAELPCADCGFPLVDKHLRWHPRIFTTGPLAELELGPISRNIAGARRAGDRIAALAMRTEKSRETTLKRAQGPYQADSRP